MAPRAIFIVHLQMQESVYRSAVSMWMARRAATMASVRRAHVPRQMVGERGVEFLRVFRLINHKYHSSCRRILYLGPG